MKGTDKMETVVKKRQLDMLNGSIWDKIPRFALPVAATAILGQLFNAADIAVVGNFTGDMSNAAVAAVGANSSIISLVVNLFLGLALGANVIIAQAIGEENNNTVEKAVHTSMVLSVVGGILTAIIGELIAAPLLNVLKVPDDVFSLALLYLRIYFAGLPVILLYNFEAAIFRSIGETKLPLIALALSGVLNVILNLFFVILLKMTVDGVAYATVISNAVSAAILYYYLRRTDKVIKVDPKKLGVDFKTFKRIIRIGLPAGIQSAVFSVANIIIQSAINSLGTVIMAASSAAYNLEIITYYLINSFSQACTAFIEQNYGAGKLDRCKKIIKLCLIEGIVVLGITVSLVLPFGKTLLSFFNKDPQVISAGYLRLTTLMLSHFFSLIYEIFAGYLRGFGISLPPAILTMIGVCGLRLSWIYFVFPKSSTFNTIMAIYPISLASTVLLLFIAVLIFRPVHKLSRAKTLESNSIS